MCIFNDYYDTKLFLQTKDEGEEGDILDIDDLEFNIINTPATNDDEPAPAEPELANKEQQWSNFSSLWNYF